MKRKHDTSPIGPECPGARAACGWTWVDWLIFAYMIVAAVCAVMGAHQHATSPEGIPRPMTVLCGVLAIAGMYGFGRLRG